jgi:uncharacterized membrane protein/Mg-chelatase subunit ChlD
MFDIAFEKPWYLLLLALIPLMWFWSFHSLSGLGKYRRVFALLFRTAVLLLMVFALADVQLLRRSDRMTVIYLLDQSASIPAQQRDEMVSYVIADVEKHRDDARSDRASVIVFGRHANIEVPPLDDNLPIVNRLETVTKLRTDATNLEGAMKLAQATFPEDSSRRIVIVSDGNENIGNARLVAKQIAEDGVGIDVVPIWLSRDRDVAVQRVAIPADIRRGQPFEARVVVNNLTPTTEPEGGKVAGRIRIIRRHGKEEEVLDESPVTLETGKSVFAFTDEIDVPDFYEYAAEFVSDNPQQDLVSQNNQATSFTHVQGKGHVLLIEDFQTRDDPDGPGEFGYLVDRLLQMDLDVTVQFSDELFTSLAELQRYDTVILANVPRSGGTVDQIQSFSDEQISMLVRNTQQMGCGLMMFGGPNSFGPGGWSNTELEKAMPVDFRIRNAKVKAVGALAMVMHASEIPEGNYWQKVIGREALKALGPQDYAAIIHWDGRQNRESWLWGSRGGFLPVGGNARLMVARLDRMTPGDMPDFEPSLKMAQSAFASLKGVAVKHMICISDGDPTPPRATTLAKLKRLGVKVTTVAVGAHGAPGHATLQKVAQATGGKYYVVRSPNALPRIYQNEARRVARPLIVEREIQPKIIANHEILRGIDAPPTLKGFVMTTVKENPLVEVSMISPYPATAENATLLATWTYGLGRAAVFTSDAGKRWTDDWTSWSQYDQFFGQLVRWSMRPTGDTGNFSVATQIKDGKTQIIIDALDKNDEFLNFLDLSASVVGPSMDAERIELRQTSPGRYVGELSTEKDGSYFVSILPGPGQAPLRTGISIPYSAEFRDRQTNRELLKGLAETSPKGGEPGILRGGPEPTPMPERFAVNSFRRDLAKAVSSNFVWPWLLLLSGCLFFGDVFVRRVAVDFEWIGPAVAQLRSRVFGRHEETAPDRELARLRNRKAEIVSQIEQRRAAVRFDVDPDAEVDTSVLDTPTATPTSTSRPQGEQEHLATDEEESFTSRLMKAKKDATKDHRKDP